MITGLQSQLVNHFLRDHIFTRSPINNQLAYPVFDWTCSRENVSSKPFFLILKLKSQQDLPSHEHGTFFLFKIFYQFNYIFKWLHTMNKGYLRPQLGGLNIMLREREREREGEREREEHWKIKHFILCSQHLVKSQMPLKKGILYRFAINLSFG